MAACDTSGGRLTVLDERILIFIVSYNASRHIRSVLDRLPEELFNDSHYHVLIIDDCSQDETAEVASAHADHLGYTNVTVLRNPVNTGYGGNQKLGYRFAIDNGYSMVVLLHGDGQYAPEQVPNLIRQCRNHQADIVLGSRMLNKQDALKGGMPFYKWVGNQILTAIQNKLAQSHLAEFHTGYRAYDIGFLKRIPFELNTDDFHFDTEILLQAFALGAKVVEFPIPTHYGEEKCHVNGLPYGWNVIKATLKYRFQKIGFFCSMQYRGLLSFSDHYGNKTEHLGSTHFRALQCIRAPARVLDLGCGPGHISKRLKAMNCEVCGVDQNSPVDYAGDQFIRLDFEKEKLSLNIGSYDYILLLDVLEHLSNPEQFLLDCRKHIGLERQPVFLVSTGNVAFVGIRLLLGIGWFTYGERGILDVTHKRLFTLASFRRLLQETGFQITRAHGIGVPFELVLDNIFGKALGWASYLLARMWPSLFAFQFLFEVKPKPNVYTFLQSAVAFKRKSAQAIETVGL
jgi:glycosyltransferase involved in cell wall biosynthesis